MATFPKATLAVRQAVGHLLLAPELEGKLCTFDELAGPLNVLGGALGRDGYKVVTGDLVKRAFALKGGEKEYMVSYSALALGDGVGENSFLLGRVGVRDGRGPKVNEVGRFTKEEGSADIELGDERLPGYCKHAEDPNHPLKRSEFKRRISGLVPQEVKDDLNKFLREEEGLQTERDAKRKQEEKAAAEAAAAKARAAEEEARRRAAEEAETEDDSDSTESPIPSPTRPASKKTRTGSREETQEELQLFLQYSEAKRRYTELAHKIALMKQRLREMKEERQAGMEEERLEEDNQSESASRPTQRWTGQRKSGIMENSDVMFIVNGRVGKFNAGRSPILFVDELEDALFDLPEEELTDKAEATRRKFRYSHGRLGRMGYWSPNTGVVIGKNRMTVLRKGQITLKKMKDLFGGGKCTFSREALVIMAAHNLHNYGGSDEATEMAIAGTLAALFHDIGFHVTAAQLGKSCPSQRTIARAEFYLAGDCLLVRLQEMRDDEVSLLGAISDHGHRNGQDHFVIVLVWAGRDKNGKRTYKFFCLSVDKAGHTADGAAEAVKKVVGRFLGDLNNDIEVFFLGGDAGGGAAVHYLHEKLVAKKVMSADSHWANCSMHGMTKMVENPAKLTMGDQGMGCRSPFQMMYVFSSLMEHLRSIGGIALLDTLWKLVKEELNNNRDWKVQAVSKMKQASASFFDSVQELEVSEEEKEERMAQWILFPRDLPQPVWSRWCTVIRVADIMLENWSAIYFFAQGVKLHYKSPKYAWKLACTLISLMNERAAPVLETVEQIEHYVDSFTEKNANERGADFLKPGDSPTFYTMLLFFKGYTDSFFNDHWAFLMRNDPYFGAGTHGQLARFMPERVYLMQKELDELKDGGWKNNPAFDAYQLALKGIPESSTDNADRAFFDDLPKRFFKEVQRNLDEHLAKRWHCSEQLHFMLGGEPRLATEYARYLVHSKEHDAPLAQTSESDETLAQISTNAYTFPSVACALGQHHKVTGDPEEAIEINVKDCMEHLTEDADLKAILKGRFITTHWNLIEKLATAEHNVRLFDKKEDGSIDRDTWGGFDFEPLIDAIHKEIGPQPHQSQKAENLVQLAALIARTKIGEKRRTWRAIACSTIIRPSNHEAVEDARKAEKDEKKREKITRISGSARIRAFNEFLGRFMAAANRAREAATAAEIKRVADSIADKKLKISFDELKEFEKAFEESIKKELATYKAETVSGYELTATMGGKVLLRILTKTNNLEREIDFEIIARKIPAEDATFIEKYGDDDADVQEILEGIPINDKKSILKAHEVRRLTALNPLLSAEEVAKTTNSIKPHCDEMQKVLERQTEILNKLTKK